MNWCVLLRYLLRVCVAARCTEMPEQDAHYHIPAVRFAFDFYIAARDFEARGLVLELLRRGVRCSCLSRCPCGLIRALWTDVRAFCHPNICRPIQTRSLPVFTSRLLCCTKSSRKCHQILNCKKHSWFVVKVNSQHVAFGVPTIQIQVLATQNHSLYCRRMLATQ